VAKREAVVQNFDNRLDTDMNSGSGRAGVAVMRTRPLPIKLRGWQAAALEIWRASDRGVVAVVTGGGKTWFALACVVDLLERKPDTSIVIVVPTTALLDQWVVVLTDDLGISPEDIATYGGGKRPGKPRLFNVMIINTARTASPEVAKSGPTFLIVDECHRAGSMDNAKSLRGSHVATLGLSATPERDFDDLFNEVVVPVLGAVIYRYDYRQALIDGVITDFDLTNVQVPLTAEEQTAYNGFTRKLAPLLRMREQGKMVDDRIQTVLRNRARVSTGAVMRIPAAVKIVESHRRIKAIIFHEQIFAADAITQFLKERGHRVAAYHSGIGLHLRQDNLRMFRRSEIDVLVTCRALDEGINVPDASLAVVVASTSSTRQRIQRLGRVLRPAAGKKKAEIYTIYATAPEAERLRREEEGLEGANSVAWQTISTDA
jgi:superfamily II DNA or RNA helicase